MVTAYSGFTESKVFRVATMSVTACFHVSPSVHIRCIGALRTCKRQQWGGCNDGPMSTGIDILHSSSAATVHPAPPTSHLPPTLVIIPPIGGLSL